MVQHEHNTFQSSFHRGRSLEWLGRDKNMKTFNPLFIEHWWHPNNLNLPITLSILFSSSGICDNDYGFPIMLFTFQSSFHRVKLVTIEKKILPDGFQSSFHRAEHHLKRLLEVMNWLSILFSSSSFDLERGILLVRTDFQSSFHRGIYSNNS